MVTFNRGLDDKFVDALNKEYDKGGWWRTLVDDEDLFVAVRNNRVNVYYRGCSLAELRRSRNGSVIASTHYKYLLRPSLRSPYIDFADGKYQLHDNLQKWFVKSPNKVDQLKLTARRYVGEEKKGVHQIIRSNPYILDVEITLQRRRLDLATLELTDEGSEIVFFEAKHFTNSELRGKDSAGVVDQISTYSALLKENRTAIAQGYARVFHNLRCLHGIPERHPKRHKWLQQIGKTAPQINTSPRLVVFGFDDDQKNGKVWKPHHKRLIDALCDERILMRGASDGFRLGMLSPKNVTRPVSTASR